ncbi:hypothetical protein ACHAQH_000276 [Verticillium albo-atrum]
MDVNEDTIPELQPIFTFLNSHANKLYQEGYFLKLDDQNTHGKPNPDRTWTECFAQLVGTVLSLWDAAELDAAGQDGEVLPKFINLTDASIKMIESLPTRTTDEQPLQNILSISTAGRNRYLLHFNSHHSLIQWTAGIRLAMFEHSTLQEAYTGALIAGKGKTLNNINIVMERSKFKTEEWVRVRFGAGVPWRRCWCVVSPPDEKEYQKAQKEMKKKSPYERSGPPILKGDIKFYDTKVEGKKQKKAKPIASISDSYSAYAIYPQAKSLIDASTLLKIEGNITIHSDPPSSTEGFVFIMPEVHPMVSGFEMLLRFLFPAWDTFALYGRPGRLVASVLDPRSLMFAMPKHRRYGYLEILDVTGLILKDGSAAWSESQWRKQLKELTGQRMNTIEDAPSPRGHSRAGSRRSNRLSGGTPQPRARVGFADDSAITNRVSRSLSLTGAPRTDSAPPQVNGPSAPEPFRQEPYGNAYQAPPPASRGIMQYRTGTQDGQSSDDEQFARNAPPGTLDGVRNLQTPEPVSRPPAFNHGPQSRPLSRPYHSPELRRANSRLSNTTLSQLAKAGGVSIPMEGHPGSYPDGRSGEDHAAMAHPSVHPHANIVGASANDDGSREAMTSLNNLQPSQGGLPPPIPPLNQKRSRSPMTQQAFGGPPPSPGPRSPLPPNPPYGGRGGPDQQNRMPPPIRPPQAPYNNFSRPDGARSPTVGGPGQMQNLDTRGLGYGQTPPLTPNSPRVPPQYQDQRPRTPNDQGGRSPMPNVEKSPPIHRKPIGGRSDSLRQQEHPNMAPGGAFGHGMNPAGFGQVQPLEPGRDRTPQPDQQIQRQYSERSGASSHYDDGSSITSPGYASTRKSSETQASVERPRAGVLRTTGGEPPVPDMPNPQTFDIPDVNFGPTINYGASPRKKTPTPINPGLQRPYSPALRSPAVASHEQGDAPPRQVPWQPSGGGNLSNSSGLSPEQYVQQRAAQAGHVRTPSNQALNNMRAKTPSPSMGRPSSQELLNRHHRNNSSGDLMQRPNSRGANHALDVGSSGEMASHLSARDQEQVARMTGAPLLSMGGGNRPPPQQQAPGGGLVGAIDAREREKQQMKQGMNNHAVQHAMQQQQRQQYQQQYQQQMQQQQAQQQQMYGQQGMYPPQNMGRGGNYGPPRQQQGQGPYGGPMPQQQGGGYRPALGPGPMPMRQGQPSPGEFMPPQGPYAAGGRPQSPGGQYGRGQQGMRPPNQGHAF